MNTPGLGGMELVFDKTREITSKVAYGDFVQYCNPVHVYYSQDNTVYVSYIP